MHQSPQKQIGSRREKYDLVAAWDLADGEAERRALRGAQPKARKFSAREDDPRDERGGRQKPRG
jgi:hypothetical protein